VEAVAFGLLLSVLVLAGARSGTAENRPDWIAFHADP